MRPPVAFEPAHQHALQLLRDARDADGTAVSRAERSVQVRREYERLTRDASAAGEDGYARDMKAAVGNPGYPRAAKLLEQAADRAGRRLSHMRRPAELEQWHVALTLALRAYLVAAAALYRAGPDELVDAARRYDAARVELEARRAEWPAARNA